MNSCSQRREGKIVVVQMYCHNPGSGRAEVKEGSGLSVRCILHCSQAEMNRKDPAPDVVDTNSIVVVEESYHPSSSSHYPKMQRKKGCCRSMRCLGIVRLLIVLSVLRRGCWSMGD